MTITHQEECYKEYSKIASHIKFACDLLIAKENISRHEAICRFFKSPDGQESKQKMREASENFTNSYI